jgi:phosphoserine phosphatase RsbU/P
VVLAFLLPRRLSRNLSRLVEATRAIGRGDFEHHLDINTHDEVEELATRFTEMQGGLQRLQQLALQDRELEIAASIQRNLLIRHIPETPGLRVSPLQRQANLVGGDWYDIDVSPHSATVVIGDASGKGIAAALMATVALSFLRAEKGVGSPPKMVVSRTNDALLDATDPDSFTTLIYTVIDTATGEARWLNMGHPAPFLLRPPTGNEDGRGYFVEGPRNRVLGWFEDPGLNVTVTQLAPGDRLVFYTDGFIEAKSADGEVFGEHRFAEALTRLAPVGSPQLGEQLVGEVERFAAGKLDDDLTMLIVEFEGVVPQVEDAAAMMDGVQSQTGEEEWHSRK